MVKAGSTIEGFIEYTKNAVGAVRRFPENYVTYFNCKLLDGECADYYGFTFDLYREYYSTISSDFSWDSTILITHMEFMRTTVISFPSQITRMSLVPR